MPREFGGKFGTECLKIRLPFHTLLQARYSVKLKKPIFLYNLSLTYLLIRPLKALSMELLRSSPQINATYSEPSLNKRLYSRDTRRQTPHSCKQGQSLLNQKKER